RGAAAAAGGGRGLPGTAAGAAARAGAAGGAARGGPRGRAENLTHPTAPAGMVSVAPATAGREPATGTTTTIPGSAAPTSPRAPCRPVCGFRDGREVGVGSPWGSRARLAGESARGSPDAARGGPPGRRARRDLLPPWMQ